MANWLGLMAQECHSGQSCTEPWFLRVERTTINKIHLTRAPTEPYDRYNGGAMPERMPDEQLLGALSEVFRAHGYEGATLAKVSEATGLQKSSLYHRFPGGKEQMAKAVLDAAAARVAGHVLAPLRGT